MSVLSDAVIVYAILKKFTTPIIETPAYKMGLVDSEGRPTEKAKSLQTEQAKDAYTLLDRLVFKLKRIWKSMPAFAKLIGGYAAALAFIKEDVGIEDDFSVFEHLDPNTADFWGNIVLGESVLPFDKVQIAAIADNSTLLRTLVEAYQNGTQDAVFEDVASMAGNAVSTGQVQGLATEPVVTKKKQKEIQQQNWEAAGDRKVEPLVS